MASAISCGSIGFEIIRAARAVRGAARGWQRDQRPAVPPNCAKTTCRKQKAAWMAAFSIPRAIGATQIRSHQQQTIRLRGRQLLLVSDDDGDVPAFAGPHPRLSE